VIVPLCQPPPSARNRSIWPLAIRSSDKARSASDCATERSWAAEWIGALLAHEKVVVTPEVKDAVWSALGSLASAPPEERTLTGLTLLLQSNALRTALGAYTLDGPYGRLLDAAEQHLAFADVQCFETEALMGQAGVVAPVLTYLFHRLEERFDGRPIGDTTSGSGAEKRTHTRACRTRSISTHGRCSRASRCPRCSGWGRN